MCIRGVIFLFVEVDEVNVLIEEDLGDGKRGFGYIVWVFRFMFDIVFLWFYICGCVLKIIWVGFMVLEIEEVLISKDIFLIYL